MNKPVAQHIHCSLRLFQHDITDQWFIYAVGWFHIQKKHLSVYVIKSLKFYFYRTANFTFYQLLRRRLAINVSNFVKFA